MSRTYLDPLCSFWTLLAACTDYSFDEMYNKAIFLLLDKQSLFPRLFNQFKCKGMPGTQE